ncbi:MULTISPECIES: sigma 54-interacting transcriptional regulator [unclassified Fibrobacter]|jgi:transcriptional regulator with PAS, ATPase and Fis domain|uniref:sigma 54-interacting transcriptional regulator n=1 Tax=unclassified Fibrobacter TaxID=2634177 RepID=UPI0015664A35|nr:MULTISPECIES: sigma-54 dependent transcriptional regulator [unclassified Fibrobacter]
MKQPNELLNIAAKSSVPVLIQGESGAGKEVAARYIHEHGHRKHGPFIAVNCAALSQNLIESTLEGSIKGAYTGSESDQKGIVRAANGGTLFLDEIGELPLEAQSKLLRILQERTVMPVGSTRSIPVDFRLVCATNRNLKEEISAKRFREDLFFRLNVFPVQILPLRERDDFDDIATSIWNGILDNVSTATLEEIPNKLTAYNLAALQRFSWPGNVRQLKNVLQRFALLCPHGIKLEEILEEEFATPAVFDSKKNIMRIWTRRRKNAPDWDIIKDALDSCDWNKCKASRKLGISRGCLCYQIQKHG